MVGGALGSGATVEVGRGVGVAVSAVADAAAGVPAPALAGGGRHGAAAGDARRRAIVDRLALP